MSDVQISLGELWNQAASQINVVNNMAAMEIQIDLMNLLIQNLIKDIQNSGEKISISNETLDCLTVLQVISNYTSVTQFDVEQTLSSMPSTPTDTPPTADDPISTTIRRKALVRELQESYYKLKAKLGLT